MTAPTLDGIANDDFIMTHSNEELQAAIKAWAKELVKSTENNWGNGKPLCDPEELNKLIDAA